MKDKYKEIFEKVMTESITSAAQIFAIIPANEIEDDVNAWHDSLTLPSKQSQFSLYYAMLDKAERENSLAYGLLSMMQYFDQQAKFFLPANGFTKRHLFADFEKNSIHNSDREEIRTDQVKHFRFFKTLIQGLNADYAIIFSLVAMFRVESYNRGILPYGDPLS